MAGIIAPIVVLAVMLYIAFSSPENKMLVSISIHRAAH